MNYTPTVFTYLSDTPEGRRLSKLGGLGLGISDLLASAVLRRMTTPISQLPTDDEGLATLVRAMPLTAHPVGTCRLGSAEASDAVADKRGRLICVVGFPLDEASIFPPGLSAGPHPT